jgi:hypothetical protein
MVGVTSVSVVTNLHWFYFCVWTQLHQHTIFLEQMLAWVDLGRVFLGAKSVSTRLSINFPKNVI